MNKFKIIILFVSILIGLHSHAQNPANFRTLAQAENWFEKNINNLKPIEGIYSIRNIIDTDSPYAGKLEFNITGVIVFDAYKGDYIFYIVDDNDNHLFISPVISVNKVPDSSSITFKNYTTPYRLYPNSNGNYNFRMQLNDYSKKKAADNSRFSYNIWSTFYLTKQFPQ